jgi:hypothetical protein
MSTYGGDVAGDEADGFLRALPPQTRAVAQRLIAAVCEQADMDAAVKWRQLTFAVEGDFDHWVCAVAPTKKRVNLTFHFGRLLRDDARRSEGLSGRRAEPVRRRGPAAPVRRPS